MKENLEFRSRLRAWLGWGSVKLLVAVVPLFAFYILIAINGLEDNIVFTSFLAALVSFVVLLLLFIVQLPYLKMLEQHIRTSTLIWVSPKSDYRSSAALLPSTHQGTSDLECDTHERPPRQIFLPVRALNSRKLTPACRLAVLEFNSLPPAIVDRNLAFVAGYIGRFDIAAAYAASDNQIVED